MEKNSTKIGNVGEKGKQKKNSRGGEKKRPGLLEPHIGSIQKRKEGTRRFMTQPERGRLKMGGVA